MKFSDFRLVAWRWWVFLVLGVLGLLFILVASIVADQSNTTDTANFLRGIIGEGRIRWLVDEIGVFVVNDAVSGVSIAFLSGLISLSLIYLFKIPEIRKTSIRAIAFGYYENFLKKLVSHCGAQHPTYRIVIIMPTYELVTQPDVYSAILRETVRKMGFQMKTREADAAFGRTAFFIEKLDRPPLPLYVDIPTTTRTLQEVLELEADMRVGKGREDRWFRARFDQLRDEFGAALRLYYPENALKNLLIITPTSQADFEGKMNAIITELEAEIEALGDDQA